jgi:hypothetical protein
MHSKGSILQIKLQPSVSRMFLEEATISLPWSSTNIFLWYQQTKLIAPQVLEIYLIVKYLSHEKK